MQWIWMKIIFLIYSRKVIRDFFRNDILGILMWPVENLTKIEKLGCYVTKKSI